MKTVTTRKAHEVIANRIDFKTSGALKGEWQIPSLMPYAGRLPREYADKYNESHRVARGYNENIYVVWSYATPIAWYTESEGWVIPPVKYSPTTTKHQGNLPARIINGTLVSR
jgi:hypothetical protein